MVNLKVIKTNNGIYEIEKQENGVVFIMFKPNKVQVEKSMQEIIDDIEDERRRNEFY